MPQNKYPLTPREKIGVALPFLLWGAYVYFHCSFSSSIGLNGLAYNFFEKFNLLIFVAPLLVYLSLKANKFLRVNKSPEIVIGLLLMAVVALCAFGSVYIRLKM